jgi:hypothetical protein
MATPIHIAIQIAAPSRALPAGATAEGYYVVEDNRVILTGRDGFPAHDPEGREYTRELGKDDNPRQVAALLLRSFRTKVRGDRVNGFDRPLIYSKAQKVPC